MLIESDNVYNGMVGSKDKKIGSKEICRKLMVMAATKTKKS